MGSLKALLLASVAGLAAMSSASAADLFLPPPPPMEAPAVASPIDFSGGGFYLRGDVGVGIADLRTNASTFDYTVPDDRYQSKSLDDSGTIDFGVGYKINNFFRVDVTGEYRSAAHFGAVESYNQGYYNTPPDATRGYDVYGGSIRSIDALLNGYVDLGTWNCLTPFVGGGVGLANNKVGTVTDQGATGGFGYSSSHSQTNFAWALMAGLAFNITPNTKIELGYRYLDLGNASSGTIVCQNQTPCPNEVQHFKLASSDIRLGVRYTFDNVPAPVPQYPIVRKY